jgi:hypothetical protein
MLKKLWQLWMLYMVLGIVDGDGAGGEAQGAEGQEGTEGGEGDEGEGLPEGDLDSLIERVEAIGEGEAEKPKPSRENEAIRAARKRAQDAEEARIRAEATLDAERRMRAPQANEDQQLWSQEEARLRDSEATDLEKWQIRSNRTLRANTQAANRALSSAADTQDRTAFDRLEITNPKVYKLYADKVERQLAEMRGRGESAPRLALLRYMIGNDVMEGKLKSGTTKKSTATETPKPGIDRGRSPGARSDVNGRGRVSEQDKRRERLRGQII